jgi:hypothetical protein
MSNRNQRQINQFFANLIAKIRKWLIKIGSPFRISRRFVRSLFNQTKGTGKSKRGTQMGFVLPTVVMVTTVVTLLVVLMVARSSERARTASNARVEQAVKLATTPAVDRARIKLEALLSEPSLGRGAPPDATLYDAVRSSERYTFNDEIRLQILSEPTVSLADVAGSSGAYKVSNTAWKYPIDTDNNGLFDSMAVYSIQFRTRPASDSTTRKSVVTEARTPPMDETNLTGNCQFDPGGGQASGWFSRGGKLKKAFFVYAATVPITQLPMPEVPTADASRYETYKGNQGFSALELQQDRAREGLNNTSVWFENDLELSQAPEFRLNGKVFTNSNLMVGALDTMRFYQISSRFSCQYKEENSQVLVAGNVVFGDAMTTNTDATGAVDFDLFQGENADPIINADETKINASTRTVNNTGPEAASNDFAYTSRVNALVQAALDRNLISVTPKFPKSVTDDVSTNGVSEADALRTYFKNRVRKVPFIEVRYGTGSTDPLGGWNQAGINNFLDNAAGTYLSISPNSGNGVVDVGGGNIEFVPPEKWAIPPYNAAPLTYDIGQGVSFPTDAANLTFGTDNLPATDPDFRKANFDKQDRLGDRILVGNNLPALWYKSDEANKFADKTINYKLGDSIKWDNNANKQRTINTRVDTLADLGDPGRGDYWEKQAAASPTSADDPSNIDAANRTCATGGCNEISPVRGGLRVITGAGIFSRRAAQTFLPAPPSLTSATNTKIDVVAGTAVDESRFNADSSASGAEQVGFVVWPDSMPMTGAVRWLDTTTTPTRTSAGYYAWDFTANNWAANGTFENRKGDLQMRATAVYHYKTSVYDPLTPSTYQTPVACVSSYYDPSTSDTARNGRYGAASLPYNYDDKGRSNNGVTYSVGLTAASITSGIFYNTSGTYQGFFGSGSLSNYGEPNPVDTTSSATNLRSRLVYQANLVYPNGRFVNPQLRAALLKAATTGSGSIAAGQLSLSEQAAVDSSMCALQILDGTLTVSTTPTTNVNVPHGTFKESTFLDGREVKSLNQDESLPTASRPDLYNLEIEQRQPIEIRATDIDFNLLRSSSVQGAINSDSTNGVPTEYLLPYSGIVYASRDDALEDLSDNSTTLDSREQLSPTDFLLDPTHRPSSIRLVNGSRLARGTTTFPQPGWSLATRGEKGLVMVTNLPVYIKGNFNQHTQQEFTVPLAADWGNFYGRNTLNSNFACRPGSPRNNCMTGDEWRAATIIADAPTVVSANSVDGYRTDGDFDLRNNADTSSVNSTTAQNRLKTAGLWNNNFVTNANYLTDAENVFPTGTVKSTYLANGTTPVQRRGETYEYSMEICRKLPASECGPNDWTGTGAGTTVMPIYSGASATPTTALRYINPDDLRFPRRVHFLRSTDLFGDGSKALVLTSTCISGQASNPIPIGVTNGNAATGGATFGYLNTASACEASASAASQSESSRAISASASSASSSSVSSSSASSASSSVYVSASASIASFASNSSVSASRSSASSASLSASSVSRSSASRASLSASSAASSVSASNASRSSASAASAISSSASRSSASASSASASSASRSSASSRASSVSASSISASASRSRASVSSASAASVVSASASSRASSVSASSISASASASRASVSSASAASLVSRSASSASSASLSSASSRSSASLSSASSASSASRSSASSASIAASSASASSVSARSIASASTSSASSASRSVVSASASASSASASTSLASSISSSVASSRSRGGAMLRPLTIAAISKPSIAIASGGTMPRLPIAAMLPRINLDLTNPLAAAYTGPGLDGSNAAKDARSAPASDYLGMTGGTNTYFGKNTPATVVRALWYRVVSGSNDALGDPTKVRYDANAANQPLYFYTAAPGTTSNGLSKTVVPKLLLPDTVRFNVASNVGEVNAAGTYDISSSAPSASDFAICTTGAGSYLNRARKTADIAGSTSSCGVLTQITDASTGFLTGLRAITSEGTGSTTIRTTRLIDKTSGLSATENISIADSDNYPKASVVVVSLPASIATANDVTLTLTDTRTVKPQDTMFVLKLPNATTIGRNATGTPPGSPSPATDHDGRGLKMKLNGVSPNNVFWVVGTNSTATLTLNAPFLKNADLGNAQHRTVLMGNFIGNGAAPTINNNVEIRNGRFLGFSSAPVVKFNNDPNTPAETGHDANGDPNAAILAMTSDAEPLVLPVLQAHAPTVEISAAGTTSLAQNTGFINDSDARWVEIAADTEVNAYFVAGNTPSRSLVTFPGATGNVTAETGGGLHNFIRYMQSWRGFNSQISGGFIQSRRSVFATAPFSATAPYRDLATANDVDGNSSAITSLFGTASNGITKQYYQSLTNQALPFYRPPGRRWGYDVGLLTQPSDLFALRFSKASPNPNEFFREVGKDDPYIQSLLCALQPANATTAVNNSARKGTGTDAEIADYTQLALPGASTCTAPTYNP